MNSLSNDSRPDASDMRHVAIREPGGPEVLILEAAELPVPAADEVLIRVHAAGVNRPDVIQRQGLYPAPPGASPIPGLEVSGEIVACGSAVSQWKRGDKVCALVNGGGYATYAVAPASWCLPIPASFTCEEAATLPEVAFTVWHNLWQRAGLRAGETLLIHGGSSGIGTFAIQLASAMGVTVLVTAGSDEKCRWCEQLGATRAINYRTEDFVSVVKTLTDGQGVDIILDMVGGEYIQKNLTVAARDGRLVSIAFLQGSRAQLDLMPIMIKRLTLTGSTLRGQSASVKAHITAELAEQVWPLLDAGTIRPVITARFPLAEAGKAHELMESGTSTGKIALVIKP